MKKTATKCIYGENEEPLTSLPKSQLNLPSSSLRTPNSTIDKSGSNQVDSLFEMLIDSVTDVRRGTGTDPAASEGNVLETAFFA